MVILNSMISGEGSSPEKMIEVLRRDFYCKEGCKPERNPACDFCEKERELLAEKRGSILMKCSTREFNSHLVEN